MKIEIRWVGRRAVLSTVDDGWGGPFEVTVRREVGMVDELPNGRYLAHVIVPTKDEPYWIVLDEPFGMLTSAIAEILRLAPR